MSERNDRKVQTLNPNTGRPDVRVDAAKYEAVRKAILAAVPRGGEGIRFKDLAEAVRAQLPGEEVPGGGSVSWYTTTVKLDLEARGQLERIAGARPQRVRRVE